MTVKEWFNSMKIARAAKGKLKINRRNQYQEVVLTMPSDRPFRILQLTDIHLGGSRISRRKDTLALTAVYAMIKEAKPDLVVITGDMVHPAPMQSFTFRNGRAVFIFCKFMQRINIPWIFTYGNHDIESYARVGAEILNSIMKCFPQCLLMPAKGVSGKSNQVLRVQDEKGRDRWLLVLLDSHSYKNGLTRTHYDYIRDNQVDWYEEQVRRFNGKVPSLVFYHIPQLEMRHICRMVRNGSKKVHRHFGHQREKVACPDVQSRLFRKMVELKSTKGVFFGHDHLNDLSVTYRNIRFTYGRAIDYIAYDRGVRGHIPRGGILIEADKKGTFEVIPLDLTPISRATIQTDVNQAEPHE